MVVGLFFLTPLSVCRAVETYGADLVAQKANISEKLAGADTIEGLIGKVISLALSFVGIVFFILILYAGVTWMTAMGNTEATTKSKSIIEAAIIGLVLISAAYAISSFVFSKLESNDTSSNQKQPTGISDCSTQGGVCRAPGKCDAVSEVEQPGSQECSALSGMVCCAIATPTGVLDCTTQGGTCSDSCTGASGGQTQECDQIGKAACCL